MAGCSRSIIDFDPEEAERIYSPVSVNANEFTTRSFSDKDGYTCVSIEHLEFAPTYYCALYTPANNLKMVLSGCSECGSVAGYKILYREDGIIDRVTKTKDIYLDEINGFDVRLLRSWLKDQSLDDRYFTISRNECGEVTSVGDVKVPYNYTATYFIKEWGPFWGSDVNGGDLGFFVLLAAKDKEKKSAVDYLYVDGNLIAEMAYWNGVFIKALFYNSEGHFYGIDENRETNVFDESHWIYHISGGFTWYDNIQH